MKKIKLQIRMYIAEVLLGWVFSISPSNNKQGKELKESIMTYFNSCVRANSL